MRCDVNISVRRVGDEKLGTRTEIKNMNSITNIAKAMEYEYNRQCRLLENGDKVMQETLRFDDVTGTTSSMRSKEDAKDYRFFREPDLTAVSLSDEEIEDISKKLPELPSVKAARYVSDFGITEADAQQLTKYRAISEYFDKAIEGMKNPRTVAKFMIGQMFGSFATESGKEQFKTKVTPTELRELLSLLEEGRINNNLAKITLEKMIESGRPLTDFISEEDMGGVDADTLASLCAQAIEGNPAAVKDYKGGKEKALMAMLGFVMRESRGKADATAAAEKLRELLRE